MSSPTSPQYRPTSTSSPSPHPHPHPNPSIPSTNPLPAWHFPFGPSSKYSSKYERPKPHHSRYKSSYVPRAPVLSTEKRAHRRLQNSSVASLPSPPASEYSRSPLSRFSSYSNPAMVSSANMPITPAKSSRRNSSLQDSPFSDYFSDDARSAINASAPSNETKALLVRMNKLQSQLMRDHSGDTNRQAISVVQKKLSEMEQDLSALQSNGRLPAELDDSGVFMSEKGAAVQTPQHSREVSCQSVDSSMIFSEDGKTLEYYKNERDWYLHRMQELLATLNEVQSELRQRHAEVKELNEFHTSYMEEKEEQVEQLRSENEGLRQDLGFEYSELLFLKLQMKSIEVEIGELRDDAGPGDAVAAKRRREKKNKILAELERWRTDGDWRDVEARFKRRRSKYGIPTSPIQKNSVPTTVGEGSEIEDEVEWQLETVKEGRGRVTSLTIKRTDSSRGIPTQKLISEEDEITSTAEPEQPVTLNGTTGMHSGASPYVENGTQTDLTIPSDLSLDEEEEDDGETSSGLFDSDDEEQEEDEPEEDVAITTSSEMNDDDEDLYQDVEEDDETVIEAPILKNVATKSAWQELWSSLSSLTGMPDDDDEED